MSKHIKMHNGYSGEIRLGKLGYTKVKRDGTIVISLRNQLGKI